MNKNSENTLRVRAKRLVEQFIGYRIERIGKQAVAFFAIGSSDDIWFSYHEQLKNILRKYRVDIVLDVGANEGQFASRLRSAFQGEIHSFEPVSTAYDKLNKLASSYDAWYAHKLALGSANGIKTIYVAKHTGFSSLLRSNEYSLRRFGDMSQAIMEEKVTVRRLDDVLDEIIPNIEAKRIFLKIDTQGHDAEVFAGIGNKINQIVALQSEVSVIPIYEDMPHWTKNLLMYEQSGFSISGMFPVTRDADKVIEYDCLFVK
jgi:FkbM family methyltransferase